jgi:hypothetical protein
MARSTIDVPVDRRSKTLRSSRYAFGQKTKKAMHCIAFFMPKRMNSVRLRGAEDLAHVTDEFNHIGIADRAEHAIAFTTRD